MLSFYYFCYEVIWSFCFRHLCFHSRNCAMSTIDIKKWLRITIFKKLTSRANHNFYHFPIFCHEQNSYKSEQEIVLNYSRRATQILIIYSLNLTQWWSLPYGVYNMGPDQRWTPFFLVNFYKIFFLFSIFFNNM